jgi:hypothetical protein
VRDFNFHFVLVITILSYHDDNLCEDETNADASDTESQIANDKVVYDSDKSDMYENDPGVLSEEVPGPEHASQTLQEHVAAHDNTVNLSSNSQYGESFFFLRKSALPL